MILAAVVMLGGEVAGPPLGQPRSPGIPGNWAHIGSRLLRLLPGRDYGLRFLAGNRLLWGAIAFFGWAPKEVAVLSSRNGWAGLWRFAGVIAGAWTSHRIGSCGDDCGQSDRLDR